MLNLITLSVPDGGNWLVQIIKWMVTISGSVALGIILFTVALKLVTFPFDYISRASMRKNSLKMEAMRPELEKLQKQYANNKEMYNQKMMALYKKNGYSMMGSCLPMIFTLVIFFVAIRAFTNFGIYQNNQYFYDMTVAYNQVIYDGIEKDNNYVTFDGVNYQVIYKDAEIVKEAFGDNFVLSLTNRQQTNQISSGNIVYTVNNFANVGLRNVLDANGNEIKDESGNNVQEEYVVDYYYTISSDKGYVIYQKHYKYENNEYNFEGGSYFYKVLPGNLDNSGLKDENGKLYSESGKESELAFIKDICQTKSAETFRRENGRFLWVKNIWVKDSPFAHPVLDYEDFVKEQSSNIPQDDYDNLTAKLSAEREAPNGYFILCVLTAGISFLTQFVTTKGQKAMTEFQTVDGQGKSSSKMMMIMMPIMMAVFSFIYTAAFSIYIFISSALGILTTLLINWITTKKYNKETVKVNGSSENEVIRGRVYVEKKPKKEEPKKVKKTKEETKGDFLKGPVNKKKK